MASRQLQVVLDLDSSSYSGKLTSAGQLMQTFSGKVSDAGRAMNTFGGQIDKTGTITTSAVSKLRDYVLTIAGLEAIISSVKNAVVGWTETAIKQSAEIERQILLMKGLSTATTDAGRTQEAREDMSKLFDMSRRTGYSINELSNAFVRMKSTGIDPWRGTLQQITDSVAAFGGNTQTMQHVSLALQEMADKGVLSMKELRRQFAIQVPDGMRVMSEALGLTMDELDKKVKAGAIAARPAMQLMLNELGILHRGAAEALAQSVNGQLNMLRTNAIEAATIFTGQETNMANSLYATVKGILTEVNRAMTDTRGKQAIAELGDSVASVVRALADVARFAVNYGSEIVFIGKAVATVFAVNMLRSWANDGVALVGSMTRATREFVASGSLVSNVTAARIRDNLAIVQGVQADQAARNAALALAEAEAEVAIQEEQNARLILERASAERRAAAATMQAVQTQMDARIALLNQMEREEAAALQQLQTGRTVNGRFIAGAAALAEYQAAVSRVATAESMLARTETDLLAAHDRLELANAQLAISEEAVATASNFASVAFGREVIAAEAAAESLTFMQRATAAGALAVEGLTAAFNIALGPIGIAALLIYQVADAAGVFTTQADKAAAAAERMRRGFQQAGDAAQVASQKAQVARELEDLQKSRNADGTVTKYSTVTTAGGPITTSSTMSKKEVDDQIAALQAKMRDFDESMRAGAAADFDRAVTRRVEVATQHYDAFANKVKADLISQRAAIEAQFGPTSSDAKQQALKAAGEAANAKLVSYHDTLVSVLSKEYAATDKNSEKGKELAATLAKVDEKTAALSNTTLRAQLSTEGQNGKLDAAGKALARMAGQAAAAQAKAEGFGGALAKLNAEIAMGMHKGEDIQHMRQYAASIDAARIAAHGMSADKAFETRLASMAGKIAQLKEELAGGTGNLAKFTAMSNAEMFKGVSQSRLDLMREMMKELDKLENDKKVKAVGDELEKKLSEAKTNADEVWASFQEGATKADSSANKLRASLLAAFIGVNIPTDKLDEYKKKIDEIIAATERARILKEAEGWSHEAKNTMDSLTDDKGDSKFAIEDAARKRDVQRFKGTLEEKKAIEKAYNDWRAAEQQRIARASLNATGQMALQWSNLAKNINQWMANSLKGFVDAMIDGKQSFGDFAKEIIKQLIKIIIEAMIAYAIMKALGMANNSAGQSVSFGDFLKGQIGSGFGGGTDTSTQIGFKLPDATAPSDGGGIAAPLHHTGGIIGQASAFKIVDPSVFIGAHKYHGGGVITQLGPKEVPMIGLEGEQVLTEDQRKQRSSGGSSSNVVAGGAPNIQVNVINNSGTDVNAEQGQPSFNGKDMIVSVVLEAANKQGPMRDMLQTFARKGK